MSTLIGLFFAVVFVLAVVSAYHQGSVAAVASALRRKPQVVNVRGLQSLFDEWSRGYTYDSEWWVELSPRERALVHRLSEFLRVHNSRVPVDVLRPTWVNARSHRA